MAAARNPRGWMTTCSYKDAKGGEETAKGGGGTER